MRRHDFMTLVGGAVVAIAPVTRAATSDARDWISRQRIRGYAVMAVAYERIF
jgi:hypothetical protein